MLCTYTINSHLRHEMAPVKEPGDAPAGRRVWTHEQLSNGGTRSTCVLTYAYDKPVGGRAEQGLEFSTSVGLGKTGSVRPILPEWQMCRAALHLLLLILQTCRSIMSANTDVLHAAAARGVLQPALPRHHFS